VGPARRGDDDRWPVGIDVPIDGQRNVEARHGVSAKLFGVAGQPDSVARLRGHVLEILAHECIALPVFSPPASTLRIGFPFPDSRGVRHN